MMATIQTCNMLEGDTTITKRMPGTIDDLDAKAAIVPTFWVVRGAYAGGTGFGMKLTLKSCLVIKNRSGKEMADIDVSGVTELDEPAEPSGAVEAPSDVAEGDDADQFQDENPMPPGF